MTEGGCGGVELKGSWRTNDGEVRGERKMKSVMLNFLLLLHLLFDCLVILFWFQYSLEVREEPSW